jgi:hypothetical protein
MSTRLAMPLGCLVLFAAMPVHAAGPWLLAPGEAFTEVRGGFSSADTYHNEDGGRVGVLFGGGEIERRSVVWATELGWKKRINFLFSIPLESATRRFGATGPTPTITGLGDAHVGFRYGLWNGPTAVALELDWKAPLAYERDLGLSREDSLQCGDANGDGDSLDANCARQVGRIRHGEGQQDVALLLHFGAAVPALRGFVQASAGYQYRFESPEDRILAGVDVGMWVWRSLMVAGRYRGAFAGEGERPTDESEEHLVGPQVLWRAAGFDVFAGSLHTASASNALHINEVFVGMAFRQTGLDRLRGYLGAAPSP